MWPADRTWRTKARGQRARGELQGRRGPGWPEGGQPDQKGDAGAVPPWRALFQKGHAASTLFSSCEWGKIRDR